MSTAVPTSFGTSTTDESSPSGVSSGSEPEPPEPESEPPAESTLFRVDAFVSERVADDHPVGTGLISMTTTLSGHLKRVAEVVHVACGCLTINLICDDEMIDLHRRFCDDDSTTDILTFDLDGAGCGEIPTSQSIASDDWSPLGLRANKKLRTCVEGDLAICIDQALRQATIRNHALIHELTLYGIHGLLHLLGHDDHEREDYEIMHELEDEILRAIGMPAIFHGGGGGGGGGDIL